MKALDRVMSKKSKEEYLESCRLRYAGRVGRGKSAMIDEVCDALGWGRKHAIKALNGQVNQGSKARKRGRKATHGEKEREVIVTIWKRAEQPCGTRLKETLPLWLASYERHHGKLGKVVKEKILGLSVRTLERITGPHRLAGSKRQGRRSGRTSNRLKSIVPVRCGPQATTQPGWFEADTVAHGGDSSSGEFMRSLTLTDHFSGWTELAALWGNSGSEVRAGLERIEKRMPVALLGFDTDNGSEFLNEVLETYLLERARKVDWTRSRPYRKNDQAHVEQKNYTHVRQLLGYGRFDDMRLKDLVEALYTEVWLPLRNHFTPVMKLESKERVGSRVKKTYDTPKTPCDRLLESAEVPAKVKARLRKERAELDPIDLADELETRLEAIFGIVEKIEEDRAEEKRWLGEEAGAATGREGSAPPPVAIAPCVSTEPSLPEERVVKRRENQHKSSRRRVS